MRAKEINDEMKLAASEALANLITDEELSPEYIIPKAFDKRVGPAVAKAVAEAAKRSRGSSYLNEIRGVTPESHETALKVMKACQIEVVE